MVLDEHFVGEELKSRPVWEDAPEIGAHPPEPGFIGCGVFPYAVAGESVIIVKVARVGVNSFVGPRACECF
jgi:hypothetical protein